MVRSIRTMDTKEGINRIYAMINAKADYFENQPVGESPDNVSAIADSIVVQSPNMGACKSDEAKNCYLDEQRMK